MFATVKMKKWATDIDDSAFVNLPVLDKFVKLELDLNKPFTTSFNDSKVIGVITDARTIGDEIEFMIFLKGDKLGSEWMNGKPVAFSIT